MADDWRHLSRRLTGSFVAILFTLVVCTSASALEAAEEAEFFETSIRPVLVEHCYECHSADADKQEASLQVDSRDGLLHGGDSGPALVPGKPADSLLLKALRHAGPEMPPDRRLPPDVIAKFETWIERGAFDPRDTDSEPLRSEQRDSTKPEVDWAAARERWAFRTPSVQPQPPVTDATWPRSPLDYFVLAQLDSRHLTPAPPAELATLRQRLSFDIVGLPASELGLQSADTAAPGDVSEWIDTLLASPRFGEHWARLWLDLARYAEDQAHIVGDDRSLCYPNAYLYRDWVITALNQDLPYDEFVRQQLAADLLPDNDKNLAALGFLGLGPKYYDRGRLAVKAEEWEDRVDTVCRSLLGLTVACARCHDHKYDPITSADYYSLASVFASTEMFNRPLRSEGVELKGEQAKNPTDAMHVVRESKPTDLHVFLRGNVESPGPESHRGFLQVLSPGERVEFSQGSGRLELANVIVSHANPLTARVFVNRVWAQLIGAPLVSSPSNFGSQGEPPSHPELLDDLAARFMAEDWSLKWLVREIVNSATYRQSSTASAESVRVDPGNRLLSHMHRKRLSVEVWRDRLLASSGSLDDAIGGESIDPCDLNNRRRTVYAFVSRFELNPLLITFDFPDANVHASRRTRTTTPIQALLLLNHPFVMEQAKRCASIATTDCPTCTSGDLNGTIKAVRLLYQHLYDREPSDTELSVGLQFLATDDPSDNEQMRRQWTEYAQALIVANETQFID
ncbi:MAG: PSD1 domain-containing protein [Planctomycetales bacterium]|nr:PSD1 domain-containing protein [Planctomycetales bacterium]